MILQGTHVNAFIETKEMVIMVGGGVGVVEMVEMQVARKMRKLERVCCKDNEDVESEVDGEGGGKRGKGGRCMGGR